MSEIQVPTIVKTGVALEAAGMAFSFISTLTTPSDRGIGITIVGLIIGLGIGALILRGLYTGRNWLRVLLTVFAVLATIALLIDLVTGLVGYTWIDLIGILIADTALVLLWLAPSRSYFDARKAARAGAAPADDPPSDAWKLPYSGD